MQVTIVKRRKERKKEGRKGNSIQKIRYMNWMKPNLRGKKENLSYILCGLEELNNKNIYSVIQGLKEKLLT